MDSVLLLRCNNLLLDILVDRSLDGAHEPSAHVASLGAEGEGSSETTAVGDTTGRDEGDLELLGRAGEEDETSNVLLSGVAGTLEAVDREDINAKLLGR